jgi:hypothetical protein
MTSRGHALLDTDVTAWRNSTASGDPARRCRIRVPLSGLDVSRTCGPATAVIPGVGSSVLLCLPSRVRAREGSDPPHGADSAVLPSLPSMPSLAARQPSPARTRDRV